MKSCGTSSLRRHLQAKHTRVYENIFGRSSPPKSEAEASASSNRRSTITNWLEKGGHFIRGVSIPLPQKLQGSVQQFLGTLHQ
ncbi:unnamed protein product [Acanthoscelides obtectus]|uniref:Uncharacterized protein n=1 Tax=Acanthoscelides obtectus TaxID=200917 RepID=A0A9P0LGX7_ACAOB|nr:unnamed protein product [Acanthoscelides obtectus]CAK1635484.1 hypothetical protein AOBTE_LOCUS9302 [Acanthoscelides obtectus]